MKKEQKSLKDKVIFLDIDGVLQPYNSKGRFEYNKKYGLKTLQEKLTKKYGIDYFQYDPYDVAACYLDWDKDAVANIKRILDTTGAKIVISSDWRSKKLPHKMIDFLKLWDMDKYWLADNCYYYSTLDPESKKIMKYEKDYVEKRKEELGNRYIDSRSVEILHYVVMNENIVNYVAIDDRSLDELPDGHFVMTDDLITDEQADKVIELLNANDNREDIINF